MKTKLIILLIFILFIGIEAQQKAKLQKADESGFIEVDEVPVLKSQLKPSYPEIARLAGIEGTVYLKILVDENGNVEKAKVEQGAKEMLDNSALQAAKKAKFSPAMINNKSVKAWVILPVAFKLDLEKKAEARVLKYSELGPPPSQNKGEDPDINTFVQAEKLPEMIESAKPEYPEIAKKAGILGKVFVKVLVDKEGSPKKAIVIKSESELFNQSAIAAAMKSKFSPAMQGGKPIAVWIVLPYKFSLDDKKDIKELPKFGIVLTPSTKEYPKEAIENKLEGNVKLKVFFDVNNNIIKVEIIEGLNKILNNAAIEFVNTRGSKLKTDYNDNIDKFLKERPETKGANKILDIAEIIIIYELKEPVK